MANAHFETTLYPRPLARINHPTSYRLHLHRHLEFICVTSGRLELRLGNEKHLLNPGDSALIVPYTLHSYLPLTADSVRFVLVLEPETIGLFGDMLLRYRPASPLIYADAMHRQFPALFETLQALADGSRQTQEDAVISSFTATVKFLDAIISLTGLKKTTVNKNHLFLDAIKLCNEHCENADFTLHTIANTLHVSDSHIKQLFAKHLHMSAKKYLTMLRMGKAEILLAEDTLSISQIAEVAGFGSVRTFNRLFKEQKGITPFAYKSTLRNEELNNL